MTQETIDAKKPTTFSSPFADTGDKNTIAASGTDVANMATGFPSIFSTPRPSGKSVARKDMNGILNAVSSLNYYFQYMGRNPWVDPNTSGSTTATGYPKGAKVWYTDSSDATKTGEYVSTIDANVSTPGGTDVVPGTTTLQWIKLNDLSGTSGGGSTVTCGWDATKIGNIISSLSTITTSISNLQIKIDSLSTGTYSPIIKSDMIADVLVDQFSNSYPPYVMLYDGYVFLSDDESSGDDISKLRIFSHYNGSNSIHEFGSKFPSGTTLSLWNGDSELTGIQRKFIEVAYDHTFSFSSTPFITSSFNSGTVAVHDTMDSTMKQYSLEIGNTGIAKVEITFPKTTSTTDYQRNDVWFATSGSFCKHRFCHVGESFSSSLTITFIVTEPNTLIYPMFHHYSGSTYAVKSVETTINAYALS